MIFYGIHGEGLGHVMRALSVMELFPDERFIAFSHKNGYEYLQENKPKNLIDIVKVKGLEFFYKNGKVSGFTNPFTIDKIYLKNKESILNAYYHYGRNDVKLCITDWESSISRFAWEQGIKCISIGNQHKFKYGSISNISLLDQIQFQIAKKFCSWMIPYATEQIVVTFKNLDFNKKECHWVPIIANNKLRELKKYREEHDVENFNLVYAKKETFNEILKKLPFQRTKVYCNCGLPDGFFEWEKLDRNNFLNDLSKCKKLYSNSGNNLITEALYLDVPINSTPIKKHFEQRLTQICLDSFVGRVEDGSYEVQSIIGKYL